MNGTEVADGRGGAKGNLMQVLLAEQDSARSLQASYDLGVCRRNSVFEYLARQRSSYSCRIDVVLDSDGDAVERTAPFAPTHLAFGFPRRRPLLSGGHRDEGVDDGVQSIDPLQTGTRQLNWRDCLSAHQTAGFANT